MDFVLNPIEARVVGCLLEKERTTPDHYPLTLNALIGACNQKSNRLPVMALDEESVSRALDSLRQKGLVCLKHTAGSRVQKHAHRLGHFVEFSPHEFAILCVLLLRGPRTAGEIRSGTVRMCTFESPAEVETTLQDLMSRGDGPFVARLPFRPGHSACRYAHLLCGEVQADEASADPLREPPAPTRPGREERLAALEQQVADLRAEVDALKQRLAPLMPPSAHEPPAESEKSVPPVV